MKARMPIVLTALAAAGLVPAAVGLTPAPARAASSTWPGSGSWR
jgi:hypothetical protein